MGIIPDSNRSTFQALDSDQTNTVVWSLRQLAYGVVPKGLFKVAKTTFGTLVYRSERQTAGKKCSSFEKLCVFDLGCMVQIGALCILM